MKASEILNKAADIIDERGHAHEYYIDNAGQVCAVGAMRLACGGEIVTQDGMLMYSVVIDDDQVAKVRQARRAIENYLNLDTITFSVIEWNDCNDKTTVVNALRDAAQWEAGKESQDNA